MPRLDTVPDLGEEACNCQNIARDKSALDSDMAAADTVGAAASDSDTAAVDIEAAADFDKAAADIEAVAGFDNCFDIAVEAAIE